MSRYIERDELISNLVELPEQERIIYMGIYDCLRSQPTADVVEVKHGRNIEDIPSLFECSLCGWCDLDLYTSDTGIYNYCPNCGARIDGGVKE